MNSNYSLLDPAAPFVAPRETHNGSSTRGSLRTPPQPRKTRHFRSEPLPEDYLEAILRLAAQAPFGCERAPWRFIVVQEPEGRRFLRGLSAENDGVDEAPAFVIAFTSKEMWKVGLETRLREEGRSWDGNGNGNGNRLDTDRETLTRVLISSTPTVWVHRQILVAITTMMLVARAYGVESAAMTGFDSDGVKERFGLPEDAEVAALLALGFPIESPEGEVAEPGLEEIVHLERYGQPWRCEAR